MKIMYREKEYDFDLDAMDVAQAKVVKVHCGLTMKGIVEGMAEMDPDAMRAAYWLMQVQSGNPCDIDRVNFPMVEFATALITASEEAEAKAKEEAENEDSPKEE